MSDITYQFHWLSFTIHAVKQEAFTFHELILEDIFGKLFSVGKGGKGYKESFHAPCELKYYFNPDDPNQLHFHVEIPGKACEALPTDHFVAINEYLEGNFKDKYRYCRADLAFDHMKFTPEEVLQAFDDEKIRTLAKRETVEIHKSPYKKKDDGTLGTCTVEFGSNESERMVTVYNKRGYTRLEFQTRGSRAQVVVNELLRVIDPDQWLPIALGHLRDYSDFDTDWWKEFIGSVARANRKVSDPKVKTMDKLRHFVGYQAAPSISTYIDTHSPEEFQLVLKEGRERRSKKYDILLNNYSTNQGVTNARTS